MYTECRFYKKNCLPLRYAAPPITCHCVRRRCVISATCFVDRKASHLEFRLRLSSVRCQWRCSTKAKGKAVLRPTTAEAALRESHKNFLQVSFLTRAIWMLFFSKLFLAYFRLQVLFVSQIVAPVVKICWEDCLFVCKH